ncbi:MAG: hypothetical protein Rubg2KO_23560 [Rubricoccaceae bacterium]
MMRSLVLIVGLVLLASSSRAQETCATGEAQVFLETTQLQVSLFNTGGLFFGGSTTSGDGYLIPKRDGYSPVFAAGLWVGGRVDGDLRVTGARYGGYRFRPGPLDASGQAPADCAAYDRIYTVSRQDVARYLATGLMSDDLRDWPHQLGAPVADGDGDPANYNLAGGDQPEILGDVNAFWVMNDVGRLRDTTQTGFSWTDPLGIEVRVLAFAFDPVFSNALSTPTFYRYQIINRSANPINDLYVSMFADVDLGDAGDDYTGTDTLKNLVYVYNDSNEDSAYGEAPPAWGIQVLDGFVGLANGRDDDFDGTVDEAGEEMLLSTAPVYPKSWGAGFNDPGPPEEYYNMQKGLFSGGSPVRAFGSGASYRFEDPRGAITVFAFPADPVQGEFWSEVNVDGQGTGSPSGDRRMLASTGPGRLLPGESVELVYGMPYARGSDHLQSVTAMRAQAGALSVLYDNGGFDFRSVEAGEYRGGDPEPPERQLELSRVRPNPSAPGHAQAVLVLPHDTRVRIAVYDALGRQLEVLVDSELAEGETVLSLPDELAPGTYVLRVEVAPGAVETLPFTVVR